MSSVHTGQDGLTAVTTSRVYAIHDDLRLATSRPQRRRLLSSTDDALSSCYRVACATERDVVTRLRGVVVGVVRDVARRVDCQRRQRQGTGEDVASSSRAEDLDGPEIDGDHDCERKPTAWETCIGNGTDVLSDRTTTSDRRSLSIIWTD